MKWLPKFVDSQTIYLDVVERCNFQLLPLLHACGARLSALTTSAVCDKRGLISVSRPRQIGSTGTLEMECEPPYGGLRARM